MSKPNKMMTALAKLFRGQPQNTLVSTLHAKAFGQPLFCHPDMGGQVLRGYLSAEQSLGRPEPGQLRGVTHKQDGIAVINVTGALVAHEMMVLCEETPLSYDRIKTELIDCLEDESVETIVFRLDSPGGEASQNCDLSDFIFQQRGQKRLIASVDDAAYSACYAIASACDEIWVTRTSGVGSVGVVSYHLDQSDFNKKVGVKIEFIHAGARKVDGNPHGPLSDEARERFQGEVSRLYDLFAETVARNLSMSVEDVKASEALTYHGQKAIDVGFAHKLGTFDELIESLLSGVDVTAQVDSIEPSSSSKFESHSGDIRLEQENSADIEVNNSNTSKKSETENKDNQPDNQKAKSDASIRAACAVVGVPHLSDDYIQSGLTPKEVREDLTSLRLTGEVEVESSQKVAVSTEESAKRVRPTNVYARRKQKR